jgi:hypothetical protein
LRYETQPTKIGDCTYEQEELQHRLTEALVVRINTKLLHKAMSISTSRYNLTFRHIKPEFLPLLDQDVQLRLPV